MKDWANWLTFFSRLRDSLWLRLWRKEVETKPIVYPKCGSMPFRHKVWSAYALCRWWRTTFFSWVRQLRVSGSWSDYIAEPVRVLLIYELCCSEPAFLSKSHAGKKNETRSDLTYCDICDTQKFVFIPKEKSLI